MAAENSDDNTSVDMLTALRGHYPTLARGEVWLVGAGPGDPGLLTLDALAGLLQADVIVHDALVDSRVLRLAGKNAVLEFTGKRGGKPSASQDDISERLVTLARSGLRVVRLKGGDPFVFGRGGEEVLALVAAKVQFRVVPGITAGLGGLAAAGIPATLRGVNQAIILATAHNPDPPSGIPRHHPPSGIPRHHEQHTTDWAALARTGQPIVLYMAIRTLEAIVAALMNGGLAAHTPAAIVASASLPEQRVVDSTLGTLVDDARASKVGAPAIVVIGDIVRHRQLSVSQEDPCARS